MSSSEKRVTLVNESKLVLEIKKVLNFMKTEEHDEIMKDCQGDANTYSATMYLKFEWLSQESPSLLELVLIDRDNFDFKLLSSYTANTNKYIRGEITKDNSYGNVGLDNYNKYMKDKFESDSFKEYMKSEKQQKWEEEQKRKRDRNVYTEVAKATNTFVKGNYTKFKENISKKEDDDDEDIDALLEWINDVPTKSNKPKNRGKKRK